MSVPHTNKGLMRIEVLDCGGYMVNQFADERKVKEDRYVFTQFPKWVQIKVKVLMNRSIGSTIPDVGSRITDTVIYIDTHQR